MEHRHFTLNAQKKIAMDRYEIEKLYIFSSEGDDAVRLQFDYVNMEKLENVMNQIIGKPYPIDNFTEYFKTHSMAEFRKLLKQWSIKATVLED